MKSMTLLTALLIVLGTAPSTFAAKTQFRKLYCTVERFDLSANFRTNAATKIIELPEDAFNEGAGIQQFSLDVDFIIHNSDKRKTDTLSLHLSFEKAGSTSGFLYGSAGGYEVESGDVTRYAEQSRPSDRFHWEAEHQTSDERTTMACLLLNSRPQ